jgi:hypothetical protein
VPRGLKNHLLDIARRAFRVERTFRSQQGGLVDTEKRQQIRS